ncbi:hypothetical protein [Segetibacter aerophilus]|uniref:Beta-lactamase-inhibitor-like PepSY-like domain-containing protein n=1 Tax=Segetibacter aerophilus TaxID=670293 RepID=A0A512BBK7_9BACT|nr:hypothetical protein [Segetibacter aerophilus]GEO09351.1 hypothetical protein SAE01_18470 [Segetibacter aerophilus]
MKKLFIAALVALTISTSAFAQDVNQIDPKAVQNFEATFVGASKVEWTSKESFTKASFLQDEQKVEVFYNPDGDLIATTKQVKMEELPTFVKRTFTKKYSDYNVTEAFKFNADAETNYFVAAENDKESIVLKVANGSISVYSRTSKI